MTTAAEVRRWLKPLLKQHPDLVLVGRNLIIPPVHHVLRGIFFDASWDKHLCRPIWYAGALFTYASPSASPPFDINEQYPLRRSNEEDFLSHVVERTEQVLRYDFSRVYDVDQYISFSKGTAREGDDRDRRIIPHRPSHYAVALCALHDLPKRRSSLLPVGGRGEPRRLRDKRRSGVASARSLSRVFLSSRPHPAPPLDTAWLRCGTSCNAATGPVSEISCGPGNRNRRRHSRSITSGSRWRFPSR